MNVILSHLILNLYHFDVYKSHLVNKFVYDYVCVVTYACAHVYGGQRIDIWCLLWLFSILCVDPGSLT